MGHKGGVSVVVVVVFKTVNNSLKLRKDLYSLSRYV